MGAVAIAQAHRFVHVSVLHGLARPPKTVGRIKIRTLNSTEVAHDAVAKTESVAVFLHT
jgi:hypothetical protein